MRRYPYPQLPPPRSIQPPRKPVPTVNFQPAINGEWTNNNSYGFKSVFNPSIVVKQLVGKLPMRGWPEVWTVQLGIETYPDPGMSGNIFASIEFGAGGTTDTVEIDWAQGSSISVPMNAASVFVSWDVGEGLNPPNVQLNIDTTFARGTKAGSAPTRKLSRILSTAPAGSAAFASNGVLTIDPGGSAVIDLPKYASHLFLAAAGPGTRDNFLVAVPSLTLTLQNPNGNVAFYRPPDVFPDGVRIPYLSTKLEVANTGLVPLDIFLTTSIGL